MIIEVVLPSQPVPSEIRRERTFEKAHRFRQTCTRSECDEQVEMIGHEHRSTNPPLAVGFEFVQFGLHDAGKWIGCESDLRAMQASSNKIVVAGLRPAPDAKSSIAPIDFGFHLGRMFYARHIGGRKAKPVGRKARPTARQTRRT